jgi:hypothetical protein
MPTCFVVMGFGEKTAFYGGRKKQRTLNLDMTYQHVIRPAVIAAGYKCIRADEILHSTVIDKPMYEQLLNADVVVADLSTSNPNAIYELGVRHALKPSTTIVIAEKEFAFPFDLGHLSILKYEHLGPDIGAGEAKRVTDELTRRLRAIGAQREVDSPVFLFLPQLEPDGNRPPPAAPPAIPGGPSLAELRAAIDEAKERVSEKEPSTWLVVAALLKEWQKRQPDEPYVVQQLALATYKSKQPNMITALVEAKRVLEVLCPRVSSDAETVGLWGAIHKRLWEQEKSREDLDEAIRAYARGFLLKYDHYNGINYAFLLNARAKLQIGDEMIADRVLASRIRGEVLKLADELLRDEQAGKAVLVGEERYWVRASRVEALFGLGRRREADQAFDEAKQLDPPPHFWMTASTEEQLRKLKALLPSG